MASFRLELLRWKMEVHAWLEAVWEGRWFGIALTSLCTAVCVYLQWKIPEPGVSVAFMGVAAALMTARTKASGPEKAVWMLIITSLLVSEVLAIRKDREANNGQMARLLSEEIAARGEAKTNFQGIGNGIKDAITQSDRQFNETMTQQSAHFDATMAKAQVNIDEITGGDSYLVVYPGFSPTTNSEFQIIVAVCHKCPQYSIQNARVFLQPDMMSGENGQLVYQGTVDPGQAVLSETKIMPNPIGETYYKITVFARNKPTFELLKVRHNDSLGRWEFSWHIERQVKRPHLNLKTQIAEGEVRKVLDDMPWNSSIKARVNPATITVTH